MQRVPRIKQPCRPTYRQASAPVGLRVCAWLRKLCQWLVIVSDCNTSISGASTTLGSTVQAGIQFVYVYLV